MYHSYINFNSEFADEDDLREMTHAIKEYCDELDISVPDENVFNEIEYYKPWKYRSGINTCLENLQPEDTLLAISPSQICNNTLELIDFLDCILAKQANVHFLNINKTFKSTVDPTKRDLSQLLVLMNAAECEFLALQEGLESDSQSLFLDNHEIIKKYFMDGVSTNAISQILNCNKEKLQEYIKDEFAYLTLIDLKNFKNIKVNGHV